MRVGDRFRIIPGGVLEKHWLIYQNGNTVHRVDEISGNLIYVKNIVNPFNRSFGICYKKECKIINFKNYAMECGGSY